MKEKLTILTNLASLAVKNTLNALFPPRCFVCSDLTAQGQGLCAPCWGEMTFVTHPLCVCCGSPFPYVMGGSSECMACLQSPPPYQMARAVFCYDDASRKLITEYKYRDRTQATPMFTAWLARAGAELLARSDVIVPVPLHRWRLLRRRYNQSALLAGSLARRNGKPMLASALVRMRNTPQQAGLTRKQRWQNMQDAFKVPPKHASSIQGKCVLLVDDVLTTGATLDACTGALLHAGAREVYVLTLARTVGNDL